MTSTSHIRPKWILILRLDNHLIMFLFMILWPAIDLLIRLPFEFPRSTTSRKELFHLGIEDCMSALIPCWRGQQLTTDPVPSAIHQRSSSIINHFTSFFTPHFGSLFAHSLCIADLLESIVFDLDGLLSAWDRTDAIAYFVNFDFLGLFRLFLLLLWFHQTIDLFERSQAPMRWDLVAILAIGLNRLGSRTRLSVDTPMVNSLPSS